MTQDVRFEGEGAIRIARLNRPEVGNSLSASMVEAFHDGLDKFERTGGRVLIVQGEGRNFCTGFDMSDLEALSDGDLLLRFVRIEELLARLWSAPYVTIAVGQGRVLGAGADLFAACRRRAAIEGATFAFPGAAFGLVLGTGRLSVRVGRDAALAIVTSGRSIDAAEAMDLGLASVCLSQSELQSWLDQEAASAQRLDAVTVGGLSRAIDQDGRQDRDLAILVRSAARAGLRERICSYRAAALSGRKPAPSGSAAVGH